jgi:hypothetical protein
VSGEGGDHRQHRSAGKMKVGEHPIDDLELEAGTDE